MNFPQNSDYTVVSNNEAASIICRFTPTMIEDIIREALNTKFTDYSYNCYNLVDTLETNYQMAVNGMGEYSSDIMRDRHDNYIRIINMVCNAHNLQYVYDDNHDVYTVATSLYSLLISEYNLFLINFFTNYINKNKDMIYESLKLEDKRKELSAYSKKIFKGNGNDKLAIIHMNLEYVLNTVLSYDIDFQQYLYYALFPNTQRSEFLQSLVFDTGDFMKRIIVPHYQNNPWIITHIRLAFQGLSDLTFTDIA